jgi:8-amino-7-oxononanoate synthase
MRPVDGRQAAHIRIDGREAANFSSNNYLGLADHPALAAAAAAAATAFGTGSGASRLIAGTLEPHRELERVLSSTYAWPAALLFNSGYHANVGLLSALAEDGDVIFSDRLNHASLIDGARLSRARVEIFAHADLADLERRLIASPGRRRLIVTDSVFSMDGDCADLGALRTLADQHAAALIVDEAHSFGVLGPHGQGACAANHVRPDVVMATFSKALGGFGAFVAGSTMLVEYLLNHARSFVFTTALPPATVAASTAAIHIVASSEGDLLRDRLAANIQRFRGGLAHLGLLAAGSGDSPIFPVHVGDDDRVMRLSDALLERGVFAQGIRPPTVPAGTARLRFSLMATHHPHQIDLALTALADAQRSGLLPRP